MAENVEYILSLKDLFSSKIKGAIADTDKLDASVNKANRSAGGLGSAFGGLKTAIGALGLGLIAKDIFTVGSSFERYEMGLKTFLKTGEEASRVFNNIKKDAATTPFEVDALFKGNTALISAGESADIARRNVLGLANAISATGGGNDELQRMVINLQQIKNTGKATQADLKQFGYAGINIYGALAAATGKSTEEVKGMEVSYEALTFALNKAAEKGGIFEGAMANAMNTTSGKFSNLKDTITFLEDKIFRSFKGTINSTMDGISGMIGAVSSGIDFLKENVESVKGVFQPLIDIIVYGWDTMKSVFQSFNLGEMFNIWANALGGLFYMLKPFAIVFIDVMSVVYKIVIGIANGIANIVLGIAKIFGYSEKKFNIGNSTDSTSTLTKAIGGSSLPGLGSMPNLLEKGSKKGHSLNSNVDAVSGSKPTSIVINIGKLVETQNFDGSATANIKGIAPKVKEEMIKVFLQMMNDSQQLITV